MGTRGDDRRLTCAAGLEVEDGKVKKDRTTWSERRRGRRRDLSCAKRGGNPSLPA
jgi:hypothetical protein